MPFRSILVPVTSAETVRACLSAALIVGRADGSLIEGMAAELRLAELASADIVGGAAFAVLNERDEYIATEARETFARFMGERGVPEATGGGRPGLGWRWREADDVGASAVGVRARIFDLVVAGRPGPSPAPAVTAVVESAIFDSGRPVLVVPPTEPTSIGRNIVIAWNCSSETAQAVAHAMPLILAAEKVTVLTVTGGTVPGPSGAELAAHLALHGVNVVEKTVDPGKRKVGEAVVAETVAAGADLMIKGAYTQSRLRQMIFGGTTSHLFAHAPVPMFMAH